VLENFLPIRGILHADVSNELRIVRRYLLTHIVAPKVGLEFPCQNFEGRALADAVGTDQTQDLTWSWGRKSMQLERVGCVSMRNLCIEVRREVDNCDRFEWTPRKQIMNAA
jgi:hypothetical protein